MSELDTEARSAGNAAIHTLRSLLDSAENRARWAAEEVAAAQRRLEAEAQEVADLKQALTRLQGGDGHGG
jgi:hypothetical protein